MNRFVLATFFTIGISAAAYGQTKAQLVLDHFEGFVRTQCAGAGGLVETPFNQPPGKITGTKTCTDFFDAGVSATTTAELSFTTLPTTITGSFVSNGGQVSGTFTPDAPVITVIALKAVLTVPEANGHASGLGDGSSECVNTNDNNFSSPFTGTRTLNLTNTCTRILGLRNISNLQTTSIRALTAAQSFGTSALGNGNSALSPPAITIQIDAIYKLELLPEQDLIITHINVIQAVQTQYDEVQLIAGKRTAARIFIRALGANAASVAGVSARLTCNGIPASAGTPPVTATPIAQEPSPDTPPDLFLSSVDVALPKACIGVGATTIEAEIVLPAGGTDPNPSNNKLIKTLTFRAPPGPQPFRVAYVTIPYQPDVSADPIFPDSAVYAGVGKQLRWMLPIPEDSLRYFPLTIDFPVYKSAITGGKQLDDFLAYFSATMLLTDPLPGEEFDQVVAALPPMPALGIAGSSTGLWNGGAGIATVVQQMPDPYWIGNSMTHEVGHNLGLRHTNKADPANNCTSVAPDAESAWPWPNALGHSHAYYQDKMQPLGELWDLMSYCDKQGRWVSAFSFESLIATDMRPVGGLPVSPPLRAAQANPEPPPVRSATPQDLWLVSGSIQADGSTGTIDPPLRSTSSRVPQTTTPAGTHCLRFSLPGNATSSFCFSPRFVDDNGAPLVSRRFSFLIPAVPAATRAALLVGSKELAAITPSGALQITITAPQAGEQWTGGKHTISWTSSGGATHYAVQYSSDGGTSWWGISSDEPDRTVTVDAAKLQGGSNVRFRVLAGAGLTTASAEVGPINVVQNPRIGVPAGTVELHNGVITQGIEREIALSNIGTGPLKITAFVPSSAQFQVISPAAPAVIPAGETVPLVLRFVPSALGDVNGNVRIDSNDATTPSITVPLHGKGIATATAEIGVTPAALAFGNVQQGKGATLTAKLINHGPAPLIVTSATVSGPGFSTPAPPSGVTLKVGETLNVQVRFVPTAVGAANGTLTFSSNDPVTPNLAVALTGTGTAATPGITAPSIDAGGVVNAASFAPGLTRGALGSVFGKNLASGTQLITAAIWPRLAQGAKVVVAGIEAPLYYVSPGLINFQVPYEVPLGSVQVVVTRDGYESNVQNVFISENSLGVFGYPRTATDYDPIIVHLDGSLVTPTNRAKAGEYLLAFVTGIGKLEAAPTSGQGIDVYPLPVALARTTITLGGAPVQSLYTGMTPGFIGLGQMNIKLPDTLPAGAFLPLRITVGNSVVTVNLHVQ